MKKLRLLMAALMSLVMLATPALADVTTAQVIRISNPTISMDGATISELDDLALQLALCESPDGSVMQMIFDLFIGGENASSAMLQLDDTAAVAFLGGMSNAYRIYYSDLAALMQAGNNYSDMLRKAESWTLPSDVVAAMEAHAADFTVSAPEVVTNSDGVVMQYYTISGDMTGCMIDILRLIENDDFLNTFLAAMDSEGAFDGMADQLVESGFTYKLDGRFGHDNFGYVNDYDLTFSTYDNGQLVSSADCTYTLSLDESNADNASFKCRIALKDETGVVISDIYFDMAMTENSFALNCAENSQNGENTDFDIVWSSANGLDSFTCTAEMVDAYGDESAFSIVGTLMDTADGWTLNANISSTEYGDTENISLKADYAEGVGTESLNATMKVADAYSVASMGLELYSDENSGVYHGALSISDEYDDVSIALHIEPTATAAGADYSGIASLLMNDGVSEIKLNVDVTLLSATVDTDNFYINPASAIDMLTISDAQDEAAAAELNAIVYSILTKLETAYPAFFGGITQGY